MGDDGHGEAVGQDVDHREAATVDRYRPLLDQIAHDRGRGLHPQRRRAGDDLADPVDVSLHEVAAEAVGQPQWALEVDGVARAKVAEVGARQRLVDDVGLPPPVAHVDDRDAAPVGGDRVAHLRVLGDDRGREPEAIALACRERSQLLNDASEHQ